MIKVLSFSLIGILFTSNLFANQVQPQLDALEGFVVHSSVHHTKIQLSDSSWDNCQPIVLEKDNQDYKSLQCELSNVELKIGDKSYELKKGKYFGPNSFATYTVFYFYTKVEIAPGIEDDLRLTVLVTAEGEKKAHFYFAKSDITEQILLK